MSEFEVALEIVNTAYETAGREMATMQPEQRRRMVGAMVQALARTCPAAVADLAGAASLAVLWPGGAK